MIRSACTLAFALVAASCAPKKAVLVEEAPAPAARTRPAGDKPVPAVADSTAGGPRVGQPGGMRVPRNLLNLPEQRDLRPTAEVKPPGGAVAIPPTADKRDGP